MTTEDLAKLLMKKQKWCYAQLARECGIRRPVVSILLRKKQKTKRRTGFHLGVVALAFKHGLKTEALEVIRSVIKVNCLKK